MSKTKKSISLKSTTFLKSSLTLTICGGLFVMSFPVQSYAQVLDEVVVTARKVDESLQEVPVAVTVIGGEELEVFNLSKAEDIATRVPSLQITVGGAGAGGSLSLRGVGNPATSAGFESAVAIVMDDAPVGSMRIVQNVFTDLDTIEVLKGPQSVFFGKSATAGVVSFQTKDPGDEFEAEISGAYEFEEERYRVNGVVSGPLGDNFGARLALSYQDADLIMRNSDQTAVDQKKGETSLDGRLTLTWDPSDRLAVNLKHSFNDYENDDGSQFVENICEQGVNGQPALGPHPQLLGLITGTPALVPGGYNCDDVGTNRFFLPDFDPISAANFPLDNNGGVPFTDQTVSLTRLKVDYDLTDSLNLGFVTGYFDLDAVHQVLPSHLEGGGAGGVEGNRTKVFTQEVRLASDLNGPFNFFLGGFYEDREVVFEATQVVFGAALTANALGLPGFVNGADPTTGFTSDYLYIASQEGTSKSLYGSVNYELTDALTLSGGLRYSDDEREQIYSVPYVHALLAGTGLPVASGYVSPLIEVSDDNISGEASITYALNDRVNIYGGYKSGYKAPGIDTAALPFVTDVGANPQGLAFDSETGEGFEVGIKSELFGRTLRLNGVAYRYVYTDLQTQQFNSSEVRFLTFNAGELTTQGIEWDALWATPVEGLTLNGSVAYLDAEFTEEVISEQGEDLNGRTPRRAPKFSGNIGLTYERPVGNNLQFNLSANTAFSSKYFLADLKAVGDFEQEGYQRFDLSAGLSTLDGKWEATLSGTNITDEIYGSVSFDRVLSLPQALTGVAPDEIRRVNRGRQVTAKLTRRF